ncbi:MAG: hypothetical protein GX838_05000 [Clostridiaceae bacterium]|nr:hypothetical protein [Clostridiaceae bacterium]
MSSVETGRILITLFQILAVLAALASALTLARHMVEKRVRSAMGRHMGSLVGKRALVVSDLRAGRPGLIRPLESTTGRESGRSHASLENATPPATFPAMANQLISRGRVVRVTGGDPEGYLVQPLEKER